MSFMDRLMRGREEELPHGWKKLEDADHFEQLIEDSYDKPVIIFKHSVSCGVSAMAKYGLESEWEFEHTDLDFYYLDLLSFRSVSNLVAERLNVIHQSPQIILLNKGEVIYNTSHHKISVGGIKTALGSLA